jgi:hypothetical protein
VGTSQAKWESNSAGPARGFTGSANDRFEKAEFSIGSAFLMVLGSPSREVVGVFVAVAQWLCWVCLKMKRRAFLRNSDSMGIYGDGFLDAPICNEAITTV